MGKRGRNRKRGDARLRVVRNDEVQQRVEVEAEMQPLMDEIRSRMREVDPLALFSFVSTLVAATDGRHGFADPSPVALEDLIDSFIDIDIAETTAVLHALAVLAPTAAMRARAGAAAGRRRQPMPRWLDELAEMTVTEAARIGFRDEPGQNFLIEYRWPGGALASYVVFDEGLGRGVKDAFPTPDPLPVIAERMRASAPPGAHLSYAPLDLATARATIEEGLANGAGRPVDQENDTWPSGRPIVEWLLTLMPAGGTAHPSTTSLAGPPDLAGRPLAGLGTTTDPDEVAEEFADSAEAASIGLDLDSVHDDAAIMEITEFAWRLGMRDPRDWEPELVQELLEDHLPRTVLPDPQTARRMGPVLEAYLRWAAEQTGRSREQKSALTRAVRRGMPGYLEVALSPAAQALRTALARYESLTETWQGLGIRVVGADLEGGPDPIGDWSSLSDEELTQLLLDDTARQVGGPAILESLDGAPLPDEDLDLARVPDDIRPAVQDVSRLVDAFADQSFGIEFRTAARRFLARAAAGDPRIFRRAARADTAAAAVAWTVARANDLVGTPGATMTVQQLGDHFGVKGTPSTRAQVFVTAVETAWQDAGGPHLGAPDLLVASRRSKLVSIRDRARTGRLVSRATSDAPGGPRTVSPATY